MLQQRLGSNFQNPTRDNFITLSDIRHIEKGIEAEKIRFNPDDGISVAQWAAKLHSADSLLGFKSRLCPVPPGSGLMKDTFTLMIQTPWQRFQYCAFASCLLCIDGTHNTTMYENTTLTTLLVRDGWGHGKCLENDVKFFY